MDLYSSLVLCVLTISTRGVAYSLKGGAEQDLLTSTNRDAGRQRPNPASSGLFRNVPLASFLSSYSDGVNNNHGQRKLLLPLATFSNYFRLPATTYQSAAFSSPISPSHPPQDTQTSSFPTSYLMVIFNDALLERGIPKEDIDSIMLEVSQRLLAAFPSYHESSRPSFLASSSSSSSSPATEGVVQAYSKRGYPGRPPIHTRFAPKFGTKLVPHQQMGESGSTLLRYGRSTESRGDGKMV